MVKLSLGKLFHKGLDRVRQSMLNGKTKLKENFPEAKPGQARDIVAEKSGFGSGKNFEKAKYISDNADDEMIKSLDEGGIETR